MAKTRTITLVYAPGIPEIEIRNLETLWKRKKNVVVNYDVYVNQITFHRGTRTVISARGIPTTELKSLRARIKAAPNGGAVFTNYDVNVRQIQQF
jgi:hypothetical protein